MQPPVAPGQTHVHQRTEFDVRYYLNRCRQFNEEINMTEFFLNATQEYIPAMTIEDITVDQKNCDDFGGHEYQPVPFCPSFVQNNPPPPPSNTDLAKCALEYRDNVINNITLFPADDSEITIYTHISRQIQLASGAFCLEGCEQTWLEEWDAAVYALRGATYDYDDTSGIRMNKSTFESLTLCRAPLYTCEQQNQGNLQKLVSHVSASSDKNLTTHLSSEIVNNCTASLCVTNIQPLQDKVFTTGESNNECKYVQGHCKFIRS
jgi:hypothetical protein